MNVKISNSNQIVWRELSVKSRLPKELEKLGEISKNLWWVWNFEARDLFKNIDNNLWKRTGHNPVAILQNLTTAQCDALVADKDFMARLDVAHKKFKVYMSEKRKADAPSIAYFSMEYGLHDSLKIYSGGLGVLAGDYLKEASDCNVNLTAVGFLYKYGYFTQELSLEGQQIANYEPQNFASLCLDQVVKEDGTPLVIEVPFPGRTVYSYVWKVSVGRVPLYLMDTDNHLNSEHDRAITHQLYGGDNEHRLRQEIMLGIGGMLTLEALGIKKEVYHCNEGHAALINVQRLCDYIEKEHLSFSEALEVVRATSLYTVHTPVPAGHDYFEESVFGRYMSAYPSRLGLSWHDFIGIGRHNPEDGGEKFSMSVFACNTCQEVNGVSWLHGKVSQVMFQPIWKGYYPEELHVSYVTNGVHMPTWTSSIMKALYERNFDKDYLKDQSNPAKWEAIYNVPDQELWDARKALKEELIHYIRRTFSQSWLKNQGDPSRIVNVLNNMDSDTLIIGFGRRFATYKRAHLLFTDLERLAKIVNNPERPVQFLFTGKAHPADGAGQGLIKRIVEISRMPQFIGKVIFLENYDMALAKRLVSGVDIWLNTPTRPLEASGTSGQKAEMNGVLNFSVLDGWWLEGYRKGAGWALTEKRAYENQDHQDQLDAATIYSILENQITPLYYSKNEMGYSPEWLKTVKNSIAQIAPIYTTKRMIDDYIAKFYTKLTQRGAEVKASNYAMARELSAWKQRVAERWNEIEVVSINRPEDLRLDHPSVGVEYTIEIVLDQKGLENSIGLELVVVGTDEFGKDKLIETQELELTKCEGTLYTYELKHKFDQAGALKVSYRMFPKNEHLPHRQDMAYVRWFC